MFLEDDNAVHKLVASQYKIAPEKLMRTGGYGGLPRKFNSGQYRCFVTLHIGSLGALLSFTINSHLLQQMNYLNYVVELLEQKKVKLLVMMSFGTTKTKNHYDF